MFNWIKNLFSSDKSFDKQKVDTEAIDPVIKDFHILYYPYSKRYYPVTGLLDWYLYYDPNTGFYKKTDSITYACFGESKKDAIRIINDYIGKLERSSKQLTITASEMKSASQDASTNENINALTSGYNTFLARKGHRY